jgi:hypothetical protein
MTYTQNPTWNNGAGPGISAGALNNIETEYLEASLSFNPDVFTAGFVLSGLVCTKDGVTASQLDITSGTAYVLQSADSTLRQRKVSTTTKSTTGNPSTTMYLDLNPDGTLSWSTAHSGQANYLTLCTVTTDVSANIATVTDTRTLTANILPNIIGPLNLPAGSTMGGTVIATGSNYVSKAGDTMTGTLATPQVTTDVVQAKSHTYIGFKNSMAGKIAEMRGDLVISGTTFFTTQASSGFNNSASFDSFDVAEIFTTDHAYDSGVVVCPGDDGAMHQCTHDGCHAALVVSKVPGLGLGAGGLNDVRPDEPYELLAIAGRVRVKTQDDQIVARQLVSADGNGGVRGMRPGEEGFALGVALDRSLNETVGILLRPMYCRAPQ